MLKKSQDARIKSQDAKVKACLLHTYMVNLRLFNRILLPLILLILGSWFLTLHSSPYCNYFFNCLLLCILFANPFGYC